MTTVPSYDDLFDLHTVDDSFEGMTLAGHETRSFGGHTLAHTLVAASSAVGGRRAPDALYAIFIAPGNSTKAITYRARVLKRGRTLDSVAIDAIQDDSLLLTATVTFRAPERSAAFAIHAPRVVGYASLPDDAPVAGAGGRRVRAPFQLRTIPNDDETDPHIFTWVRWRDGPPSVDVHVTSPALLAFALDFLITRPGRIALGQGGSQAVGASLNQAMWFHRDVFVSDWFLVHAQCLSVSNARAVCTASVFTESGLLIATATQQILLRTPIANMGTLKPPTQTKIGLTHD